MKIKKELFNLLFEFFYQQFVDSEFGQKIGNLIAGPSNHLSWCIDSDHITEKCSVFGPTHGRSQIGIGRVIHGRHSSWQISSVLVGASHVSVALIVLASGRISTWAVQLSAFGSGQVVVLRHVSLITFLRHGRFPASTIAGCRFASKVGNSSVQTVRRKTNYSKWINEKKN